MLIFKPSNIPINFDQIKKESVVFYNEKATISYIIPADESGNLNPIQFLRFNYADEKEFKECLTWISENNYPALIWIGTCSQIDAPFFLKDNNLCYAYEGFLKPIKSAHEIHQNFINMAENLDNLICDATIWAVEQLLFPYDSFVFMDAAGKVNWVKKQNTYEKDGLTFARRGHTPNNKIFDTIGWMNGEFCEC